MTTQAGGTASVADPDIVIVGRGDQVPVDGTVLVSAGLEVDESMLTGESDAVAKHSGDAVYSGSAALAGAAHYVVDAVGDAGMANSLIARAREFQPVRSEIRHGIEGMLRVVTWLLVPTAALLTWSQLVANETVGQAVAGTVAGVVSMVPEGLVLLTTMAMAIGVVRLGRRNVLTRDLAAIEGLARIDVLCVDKTGTLTRSGLEVHRIVALGDGSEAELHAALGALGRLEDHRRPTASALVAAVADPGWCAADIVAFSSERKWSGADYGEAGIWLLGAADVLLTDPALRERADLEAAAGRRVMVAGRAGSIDPSTDFVPLGIVMFTEPVKEDAAETLRYLAEQGVEIKVISGDHPRTVAAVAAAVGLRAAHIIDARDYRTDAALLDDAARADVIGRTSPAQKAAIVGRLQADGRTVAMTGDGVNDLLALKRADVGIAMGSGSAACRGVAQLVLLDDGFSALPGAVREGRRVIGNVERVAELFLVKSVYAFLLAIAIGVAQLPFPVLPRHLTLVAGLTIGIPGFFLALESRPHVVRHGFVGRVLGFAIPTGLVAAVATFVAYADIGSDGATIGQSRTTATIILFVVGTWAMTTVARPLAARHLVLVASMIGLFAATMVVPATRRYFGLVVPPTGEWSTIVAVAVVALVAAQVLFVRTEPVVTQFVERRRMSARPAVKASSRSRP